MWSMGPPWGGDISAETYKIKRNSQAELRSGSLGRGAAYNRVGKWKTAWLSGNACGSGGWSAGWEEGGPVPRWPPLIWLFLHNPHLGPGRPCCSWLSGALQPQDPCSHCCLCLQPSSLRCLCGNSPTSYKSMLPSHLLHEHPRHQQTFIITCTPTPHSSPAPTFLLSMENLLTDYVFIMPIFCLPHY